MNQVRIALSLVILTLLLLRATPSWAAVQVAISAPSTLITNKGPVSYTLTYTGATTINLLPSHIAVSTVDSAPGVLPGVAFDAITPLDISCSGNTSCNVSIKNISGNGSVFISVASGTADSGTDGNAAGPSTSFIVDNLAPTVKVNPP
ncbi:MAG: hypothetical protein WCP33_07665, partial [Deltaproteobacteria bacterium]